MKTIKKNIKKSTVIKAVLIGWFLFCWSWTLVTDSLNLAGSYAQGVTLAVIISSINISLSVFIIWQTYKILVRLFSKIDNPYLALVIPLPLLALADFLVAWVVAFIWLGPQGQIDSVLPLASPSLLLINTPFGFASRIVGFYGLASFLWLILFLMSSKKTRMLSIAPAILLSILSLAGWYIYKEANGSEFKATIISENLDNRVNSIETEGVDLVIFPEYGLDKITNDNLDTRILLDNPNTSFIGSEQVIPLEKVGHYNRLIFGNTSDGIKKKQDKYRMIPGGEDLPYTLRIGLRATNQKATLDYFSFAKATIKGPRQLDNFRINNDTELGVAVCSSIISPEDYRSFTKNGATALTNSASLTIFKGSRVFAWQQKSMAKFMATSNSRYFLQSANAATAYALDNNGREIASVSDIEARNVMVKNNDSKTIYTLVGEWLVVLGAIAVMIYLLRQYLRNLNNIKKHKKKK